jgi:hypothetical protein
MDALRAAANSPGVQALINDFYHLDVVQGFALRVHGNYISMFRSEFDRSKSVNEILQDGRVPMDWSAVCQSAGYVSTLSPIYVLMYVSIDANVFRSTYPVPATVQPNYAVFVETVAPFIATANRGKHRPILGGISIGSVAKQRLSGTLGGLLTDESSTNAYILSCNHVLLSPGDDVVQQGRGDRGRSPADTVAVTKYVVPLQTAAVNSVDAALAEVDGGTAATGTVRLLGPIARMVSTSSVNLGDLVVFVGKESDRQDAYIHSFIARVKADIDGGRYDFGDIFEIRPRMPIYIGSLSQPGDSGSWVVRETGNVVDELCGLLFADNARGDSLCCFIENVLKELETISGIKFRIY